MKAYRAALLRFDDDHNPIYESDGLLVVGPDATGRRVVRAVGSYNALVDRFPGVAVEDR
jgi:guanine deaminase